MPSTRKQKAKEKRSRQSDVMSDIENLDVMLGKYQENEQFRVGNITEGEIDLESQRRQRGTAPVDSNYRSLLNTNLSENSEITIETSRAINSEFSSQMSRKLEEMKSDLNSHILEVINSAIEDKILPSIENVITSSKEAKNTKWDLRSDGRHPSRNVQMVHNLDHESDGRHPSRNVQMVHNLDHESDGRHKSKFGQHVKDSEDHFPKLIATSSNQNHRCRENLVDSDQSDEGGYDMVTGANLTPPIVPEFLTGRPMQSRNTIPHPNIGTDDTLETTLPAQQNPIPNTATEAPTNLQ